MAARTGMALVPAHHHAGQEGKIEHYSGFFVKTRCTVTPEENLSNASPVFQHLLSSIPKQSEPSNLVFLKGGNYFCGGSCYLSILEASMIFWIWAFYVLSDNYVYATSSRGRI